MRRTNATWRERIAILAVHGAGLLDALIYVGSLTLLTSDLRAAVLFSDWMEKMER